MRPQQHPVLKARHAAEVRLHEDPQRKRLTADCALVRVAGDQADLSPLVRRIHPLNEVAQVQMRDGPHLRPSKNCSAEEVERRYALGTKCFPSLINGRLTWESEP